MRYYLAKQQQTGAYRIDKYKQKEVKKERNFKLHNKLKEYSEKVKKQIAKRDGAVYQPGIGMDGGYCELAADPAAPPAANICSACGEAGHKLRTNKKCKYYVARNTKKATDAADVTEEDSEENPDAGEQDLMDNVQFEESDDEFFDALEDDDDCDTGFLF